MPYCDRGLRRLGSELVAQEKPNTKTAAKDLIRARMGAYFKDKSAIEIIVKTAYS